MSLPENVLPNLLSQIKVANVQTFQRFTDLGKLAKFPDSGSVLGSSQFSILPQLPPKILLNSKVVKIDPK